MKSRKKSTFAQEIKGLAKIHGKDIFPDVRLPRKRAKETKPRKKYDRAEDIIRNEIIKVLRGRGMLVYRVENAICGRHNIGIPDIWVFNVHKGKGAWIEVKSTAGVMSLEQRDFQHYCVVCNINHYVCRSVEDAIKALT